MVVVVCGSQATPQGCTGTALTVIRFVLSVRLQIPRDKIVNFSGSAWIPRTRLTQMDGTNAVPPVTLLHMGIVQVEPFVLQGCVLRE